MESDMWAFFIGALISVFAIINPVSTIGVYLSLTKNEKEHTRHRIAFLVSLVAFVVLIFFAITGFFLFQIYGITLEAFRIAGGIILSIIGIRMLFPPANESGKPAVGAQFYIVPLAIPMTSGPGAITTVVVLASQARNTWLEIALWSAIFISCFLNYIILRFSDKIEQTFGKEGIGVLVKIMGLLVCSIGVQFIINGLKVTFPVLA